MGKKIEVAKPISKDQIIKRQAEEIQGLRDIVHHRKFDNMHTPENPMMANSCSNGSGYGGQAASPSPSLGQINKGPPTRPTIGEAANRIHDHLDKLHGVIDALAERLSSVSISYPKQVQGAAVATPPTACQHIATLEAAQERVSIATRKVVDMLDALMV